MLYLLRHPEVLQAVLKGSLVVFNAGFDVTRDSCCYCVSVSNTGFDISKDSCFDCKSVRLQTSECCMQGIGKQAFTPDALPTSGSMRGISTRLLLAVCGNGDSNIQFLKQRWAALAPAFTYQILIHRCNRGELCRAEQQHGPQGYLTAAAAHLRRLDLRWTIRRESSQVFYAVCKGVLMLLIPSVVALLC